MKVDVDVAQVLESNRRFHDEVEAPGYDQRMDVRHDSEATYRMLAELERVLGEDLPGGAVLDVGTGTGHVAIKLAKSKRFTRVLAADISAAMLARARENADAQGCTIETVESDMLRLPFEDGTLDAVVGCAVLHHLPDPPAFLREVLRVLKPGAPCIFIGDPSTWGNRVVETLKLPLVVAGRALKKLRGTKRESWKYQHIDVHTFTVREVRAMTSGFEHVRIVPEGFLEPMLDGSILTAVREVLGSVPGVTPTVSAARASLRWLDRSFFDRAVPGDLCGNLKFSARRPSLRIEVARARTAGPEAPGRGRRQATA
jgi:ubiquinone/menaquinone biosynthesis C-methylase UbiE